MKKANPISLFLCLCLVSAMLLPMLSACNENGGEQATTDIPTNGETSAPGESTEIASDTPTQTETDTEPGDMTDESTAPDTEQVTEPDTESDTESNTEQGTESPPAEQAWSLPILRIQTNDGHGIYDTESYKGCMITLENCSEPMQFSDISASIRVRGNSTAVPDKKPYRIKFDKKRNMLGLNDGAKCKSWCLMADYYDYSLMRNSLSFRMAGELLDGYSFASECAWVEVYVNDEYRGVYLLCEQTQINKHRVNIYEKEATETNLEIGYLMVGQGGRTNEPNTVQINFGGGAMPDRDGTVMSFGGGNFSLSSGGDYTQEQINFCSKVVGNIARICYYAIIENAYYELDDNWNLTPKTSFVGKTDEEKQIETIAAYVDIESAVRIYMTDEIVKNLDSGTYNMYIDLSPNGAKKLTFGPPWDYDFALANTKYNTTHSYKGLYAANFSVSDGMRVNTWFVLFCNAEWFRDMCKPIWMEQREDLFAICESIRTDASTHKDAFDRNFERWDLLGTMNQGHQADDVYGFEEHMDAADFLYDWLYNRLVYLDTYWGDRVVVEPEEDKEFSHIDFSVADRSDLFEGENNCSGSFRESSYYRLKVLEPHDPYVHIKLEDRGADLNAEDYSYIEITYRIPKTNRKDDYNGELFLCAGQYYNPTGGVSVHFDLIFDGEWHTVRIPLPTSVWSGEVHQLRLDFFNGCERGDEFHLQSIVLTN